jgi:hypothetical protein
MPQYACLLENTAVRADSLVIVCTPIAAYLGFSVVLTEPSYLLRHVCSHPVSHTLLLSMYTLSLRCVWRASLWGLPTGR